MTVLPVASMDHEIYKSPQATRADMSGGKEESFSQLLTGFVEGTTAHGLPKVVTSGTYFRRILWMVIFLTAFSYFIYQSTILFSMYFSHPVAVKIDIVNMQTVKFPAVTVCNMNMLKKNEVSTDEHYKGLVKIDRLTFIAISKLLATASSSNTTKGRRTKRTLRHRAGDGIIRDNRTRAGTRPEVIVSTSGQEQHAEVASDGNVHQPYSAAKKSDKSKDAMLANDSDVREVKKFDAGAAKNSSNDDVPHKNSVISNKTKTGDSIKEELPADMTHDLEAEGLQPVDPDDQTLQGTPLRKIRVNEEAHFDILNNGSHQQDTVAGRVRRQATDYGSGEPGNEQGSDPNLGGHNADVGDSDSIVSPDDDDDGGSYDESLGVDEYHDAWYDEDYGFTDMTDVNWENFHLDDYGFFGIENDYDFEAFMKASRTDDFSDLVDILKPTREDLDKFGHQADDFIIQCSFDKNNCTHKDFRKVYNPYYGLCYVFNHGHDDFDVIETSKFGSRYGLRLTLDIEFDEYLGLVSHKAGVRLAIHPYDVTSFPQDFGVSAAPGMETEISVSLETMTRQPAPYPSNCTDGSDQELEFEGNYTIIACLMSCLQHKLRDRCGCVDKLVTNEPRCSVTNRTQETCRQMVYFMYDSSQLGCDCPPSCHEASYRIYTSLSDWPSTPYHYLLAGSLLQLDRNYLDPDMLDSILSTLVRVHVYLNDPTTVSIEEYPSYPWDRLLADIGGLLGLFVGISACTAIELLELFVDSAILGVRTCSRRRQKRAVQPKCQVLPEDCAGAVRSGRYGYKMTAISS